jgi:PAS domain S-box-containing protein
MPPEPDPRFETISPAVIWAALEHAPDAVVITNTDATIMYANEMCGRVFGHDPQSLVGKPIDIVIPVSARSVHRRHHEQYSADPTARPMGHGRRLTALHRDGFEVPVEISLSPVNDEFVIAVVRDVTEQRRFEQQLIDAAASLAHAEAQLVVADERERIARDLHDTVIQRLFSTGMSLQAAIGRPDADARMTTAVESIDIAIRDLRTSIFTLRRQRDEHNDHGNDHDRGNNHRSD